MNSEIYNRITDALLRWNYWGNYKEKLFERHGLDSARKIMKNKIALALLGIRRCGKSKFSILLLGKLGKEKNTLIMNFEDPVISSYIKDGVALIDYIDLFSKQKFKPDVLILDEPDKVEGWYSVVRTLLDTGFSNVIITGSNKSLLEGEIASVLGGRYVEYLLYPLSFTEFLSFKKEKHFESLSKRQVYLEEYLRYGGFPAVVLSKEKHVLLSSYFKSIVVNDVSLRLNVRDSKKLETIARILAENPATLLSLNRIAKAVGISTERVESYTNAFEEVYYVTLVEKISPKTMEPISTVKKMLLTDSGFHTLFYSGRGQKRARILENAVGIELIRRYGRKNIFYYKSEGGYEVDFVVRDKNNVAKLVQVSYSLEDKKAMERELKALVKAAGEFNTNDLRVITWDYNGKLKFKGHSIKCVKLWDFLKSKK